jgi:F-type H+-transporting ATPase subunit delta
MQAASRESYRGATDRLQEYAERAQPAELERLAEELFVVAGLLIDEPVLRRHLADPGAGESSRAGLVDSLLGGKVQQDTMDVLHALVRSRWSRPEDLLDAVESLSRQATLAVAQRDGSIEEVEDELFRFGRILAAHSRLRRLLADPVTPAAHRVELLDVLLADRVRPATRTLLRQVVRAPRGRSLDRAAEELAELAAASRQRSIAHVQVAAPLSAEQEERLAGTLSRIYRRQVALQVEVHPDLLGGVLVRVGDEVIDGTVASRLAAGRRALAG